MKHQIISEEKRRSILASMVPVADKIETKPVRHISLSQPHYQEPQEKPLLLLQGFILSLKVSIT